MSPRAPSKQLDLSLLLIWLVLIMDLLLCTNSCYQYIEPSSLKITCRDWNETIPPSLFVFIHSVSHLLRRFSLILESGCVLFILFHDHISRISHQWYFHINDMIIPPMKTCNWNGQNGQSNVKPGWNTFLHIDQDHIEGSDHIWAFASFSQELFLTQCSPASPSEEKFASSPRSPSWELRWISCGGKHWRDRPCGAPAHPYQIPHHRHSYHSPLSALEDRLAN